MSELFRVYKHVPPWPLEGEALQRIRAALMDLMPLGRPVLGDVLKVTTAMFGHMVNASPEAAKSPSEPRYLRTAPAPSLEYLRSLVSLGPDDEGGEHEAALLALADVDGTCIQKGDVLLKIWRAREPQNRGRAIRVPRSELATIAERLDMFELLELRQAYTPYTVSKLRSDLRRRQQPTWKDETSPFLIVRPLVAPVSEPITASSDEAAIFELLCSVGGRMPALA